MNFEAFTKEIKQYNVYGVEVYEDGILTHSYGDTTENIHELFSATKSVVSIATGIIYDRGLVDFQKTLLEYLPKSYIAEMSEEQKNTFRKLPLYRLLTMSVPGFPFRPEGDNYLRFCLSCKLDNPDERSFNYSNINTYLICVALTEILGSDLGGFIEKEIFLPLGITRFEYGRSPEGYFYGASTLKLTVHDLSKFGQLMINGGVYNGKRIVSEEYVKMATSIQQQNREGGYGYFFWKYREGFSINGKWGQKCYCLPDRKMTVAFLSNNEGGSDAIRESMEKYILEVE